MKKRKTGRFRYSLCQDSCRPRRGASAGSARTRWAAAMIALLGLLACAPSLQAKKPAPPTTKTISGAVLDQFNNGISGASVMLLDLETHKTDAMYSGANGAYAFSGLSPNDDYRLQASYKNITSGVRHVSSLDSRTEIVVNLIVSVPANGAAHASQ